MKHIKSILSLFFISCTSLLMSCNKYIDATKSKVETKVADGVFIFYPDKNVLTYRNKVGISKDTETYYPKNFEVLLPKKLLYYQISNSTDFYFFYPDKQVVYIKIDLEGKNAVSDTVITPSENEVNPLIKENNFSQKDKFNIDKIGFDPSKKQYLIRKGAASILLYNIKEKNEIAFLQNLKKFKFLP